MSNSRRHRPVAANVAEALEQGYPNWVCQLLDLLGPDVRVQHFAPLFGRAFGAQRELCGHDDTSVSPLHHYLRNSLELFTKGATADESGAAAVALAGHMKERRVADCWMTISTWLKVWDITQDEPAKAMLRRVPTYTIVPGTKRKAAKRA